MQPLKLSMWSVVCKPGRSELLLFGSGIGQCNEVQKDGMQCEEVLRELELVEDETNGLCKVGGIINHMELHGTMSAATASGNEINCVKLALSELEHTGSSALVGSTQGRRQAGLSRIRSEWTAKRDGMSFPTSCPKGLVSSPDLHNLSAEGMPSYLSVGNHGLAMSPTSTPACPAGVITCPAGVTADLIGATMNGFSGVELVPCELEHCNRMAVTKGGHHVRCPAP